MAVQPRPPVVTIMGHVDHGKTSLLDAIRKTSVAAKEAGGITQHIGAYQVTHNGKQLTFIDTPGHAAFSKMRSRGASTTDIVVLVVAATEGVKPQTVESIQHIKQSGAQYLVALTKMDLPDANPELVKAQLTEHEVFVEGYGGEIVVVPVSAKTGEGLDKLLEMILLIAEMAEFQADPVAPLEAVIIESKKDMHKGSVATVLVKQGTVKLGDTIYAESVACKVRSLQDANGKPLAQVTPSMPAEVLGWEAVPPVGSVVSTEKKLQVSALTNATVAPVADDGTPKLYVILKSDVAGTLEALEQSIATKEIIVVAKSVGDITENDVLLAEATHAVVYGFHVKAATSIKKMAEGLKVKIRLYTIIYDLIEDLQKQVLRLIEPTIDEEELGVAEIIAIFDMRGERVAGCKVKTGELTKNVLYHVKRKGEIVASPRLKSMKHGKVDIESAKIGAELGIVFQRYTDLQVGDEVVAYRMKEE